MDDYKKPFGAMGWISVLLAIGFIIGAVIISFDTSDVKSENSRLAGKLEAVRSKYASMSEYDVTVEYIEQILYSAKDAGKIVAESINNAHNIIWNAETMPDYTAAKKEYTKVSEYFPSGSDNGNTWYACYDEESGDRSRWEFMTTYSISGSKIDCVWLCYRESDNQILAYVTSVFDAKAGRFDTYTHHTTVYGSAWQSLLNETDIQDW